MKHEGENRRGARWPWVSSLCTMAAGLMLSLALWQARTTSERQRLEEDFLFDAQLARQRIDNSLNLFMGVLDSIRYLHTLSDRITEEDFAEFVAKGMMYQQEVLGGFGFAQRIADEVRPALETASDEETAAFRLVEADGQGGYAPARRRPVYYPLTYQTSANILGVPVGFDFSSSEENLQAIRSMEETGGGTMGGRLIPRAGDEGYAGVYIFSPIFQAQNPAGRKGPLIGFSVAVLKPATLLAQIQEDAGARHLRVQLVDPGARPPPAQPRLSIEEGSPVYEAPLFLAGRTWVFRMVAEAGYVQAHTSQQAGILLLAGLLVTGLLTSQLLVLAGRARKIEKVVRARTSELSRANNRLLEEMAERSRLESEIMEITGREQQRLGRDLHDSLGQKLTGAVFLTRALIGKLPEEDRAAAERINDVLKESVAQVRRIARGLAPVELGQDGLADALKRLAEEARETYGIACEAVIEETAGLPGGKSASHLYHLAQEAVSNAARHGKAAEIVITLSAGPHKGRLEIRDDGTGLPAGAEDRGGMGLKIMRHRAKQVGGTLEVKSQADGGVQIICHFSLSPDH